MVWVHVALATLTWLVTLWAIAAEGSFVPRRAAVPAYGAEAQADLASTQASVTA